MLLVLMFNSSSFTFRSASFTRRSLASCWRSCCSSRRAVLYSNSACLTLSVVPEPKLSRRLSLRRFTSMLPSRISSTSTFMARSLREVSLFTRSCSSCKAFMCCSSLSLPKSVSALCRSSFKMGVPTSTLSPPLLYASKIRVEIGELMISSIAGDTLPVAVTLTSIVPRLTSLTIRSSRLTLVRIRLMKMMPTTNTQPPMMPPLISFFLRAKSFSSLVICLSIFITLNITFEMSYNNLQKLCQNVNLLIMSIGIQKQVSIFGHLFILSYTNFNDYCDTMRSL